MTIELLEGVESLDRGERKLITPEYWDGLRAKIRELSGEDERRVLHGARDLDSI